MTPKEIKNTEQINLSTNGWLKEIAYQLAILNEQRKPGRPKRGTDGNGA
jgi:hypothetical protein